jgi:hypothetical protein
MWNSYIYINTMYYHDQWVTYIDLLSHWAEAVDVELTHLHQTCYINTAIMINR